MHRTVRLGAGLWRDADRPPLPPLPPPSELPADDEVIAEAIGRTVSEPQRRLLQARRVSRIREALGADHLPTPAVADREGYYPGNDLGFWLSGYGDCLLLDDVAGLTEGKRVLDFGSASGRLLRHLHNWGGLDVYGVEISAQHVSWNRTNLPAAVATAQTTILPSLPFADGSFDVIYAGSVFTHIDAFEEAWLLELGRVLAPGGTAVLTFHPERLWEEMRDPGHELRRTIGSRRHRMDPGGLDPVDPDVFMAARPADRVIFTAVDSVVYGVQAIHAHAWVRERWGRLVPVDHIVERVNGDHQDAAVIRKP